MAASRNGAGPVPGGRLGLPWLLGLCGLTLAVWVFTRHNPSWELLSADAHEYAEMARRLARGDGFTTGILYPAELHLGVNEERAATMRPPGWPLLLAGFFALFGPRPEVAHAAVLVCVLACVLLGAGMAARLAGPAVGVIAGIALATSLHVRMLSIDAVSEAAFALWVTLGFALSLRGSSAREFGGCLSLAIGVASGAAYLTRYNGFVLLPALLGGLWWCGARRRVLALCALGFALVALPWWLRNLAVVGNPFYSLLNLNLYFDPGVMRHNTSLYYMLEPDLNSAVAMRPLDKFVLQMPKLLLHFPPAGVHWVSVVGLGIACWRREGMALALGAALAATLGVVSLAIPLTRYFVPFTPALVAIGAAAWWRYGGRLRVPALALIALGALLPPVPPELSDMRLFRPFLAPSAPDAFTSPVPRSREWPCIEGRPLVVAQRADRFAWQTDAVAIYAPASAGDFWSIVDSYPVEYVDLPPLRRDLLTPELERVFRARPDCGPNLYERRRKE